MRSLKTWLGAALLGLGFLATAPAMAQERASKEEAIAFVKAGVAHIKKVGAEKAYQDFTTDKANWVKKDLYLMVYDAKNVGLAHGANEKIVGRDMTEVKDAKGVAIVPEMNKIAATKGTGWLDYDWPHPQTKKIEPKTTYVEKLPTAAGFLGAGIYR